jgi:hypothetical protein
MAKVCEVKLTVGNEMTDVKNEKTGDFFSVREIEKMTLESLFVIAANMQKEFKKLNICYDLIEEVKEIKDDAGCFKISTTELKEYLIPAIEKSVDKRPGPWYYARKMFKSIENPKEIEV